MTFARYSMSEGAQTVSMLGWISLYAGEGTLNFNQNMWHTQAFTEGDNCFAFIKYILGMDTFTDFWNAEITGDLKWEYLPVDSIPLLVTYIQI